MWQEAAGALSASFVPWSGGQGQDHASGYWSCGGEWQGIRDIRVSLHDLNVLIYARGRGQKKKSTHHIWDRKGLFLLRCKLSHRVENSIMVKGSVGLAATCEVSVLEVQSWRAPGTVASPGIILCVGRR